MTRKTRRKSHGFTLLEMLIVGLIGIILVNVIANAWRWYGRSLTALEVTSQLVRELKLASDAIALDYGTASSAQSPDGDTLQMNVSGTNIEFVVTGGKFVRRNLTAGTELSLAKHLSSIEAQTVDGKLQVKLTASLRDTDQAVTLQLEGP